MTLPDRPFAGLFHLVTFHLAAFIACFEGSGSILKNHLPLKRGLSLSIFPFSILFVQHGGCFQREAMLLKKVLN